MNASVERAFESFQVGGPAPAAGRVRSYASQGPVTDLIAVPRDAQGSWEQNKNSVPNPGDIVTLIINVTDGFEGDVEIDIEGSQAMTGSLDSPTSIDSVHFDKNVTSKTVGFYAPDLSSYLITAGGRTEEFRTTSEVRPTRSGSNDDDDDQQQQTPAFLQDPMVLGGGAVLLVLVVALSG